MEPGTGPQTVTEIGPNTCSDAMSEQRLAAGRGNTRAPARRPGRRTGAEHSLDGGGDELGGLGVDSDVAPEQHAANDLPSVPGHILRAVGHVSAPS